ncbi:MAG: DUF2500 domain-containing protein [Clostridiaceae bacterium]|nr:DUF2500 domain-containing protein [Clostridiaceae bacterium]
MAPSWFGSMFGIVPIIVILGFIFVFTYIIISLIQSGMQWNRNNHSPVLTVDARVIAKRTDYRRHLHHHGHMRTHHTSMTSSYYVTFEFESGDRMEFQVPGAEYGYLIEGDFGKLTFQGTRYKAFKRI